MTTFMTQLSYSSASIKGNYIKRPRTPAILHEYRHALVERNFARTQDGIFICVERIPADGVHIRAYIFIPYRRYRHTHIAHCGHRRLRYRAAYRRKAIQQYANEQHSGQMPRRVGVHHGVVPAVGIAVIAVRTAVCAEAFDIVRADEPAGLGIIVARIQVIPACLRIVVAVLVAIRITTRGCF